MTIGAELVDAAGGWRLWGEQYHFKLSGTFSIQTEILEGICDKVRQRLTEADTHTHGLFCNTAACLDFSLDSLRLSALEKTLEAAVKRRILQDGD